MKRVEASGAWWRCGRTTERCARLNREKVGRGPGRSSLSVVLQRLASSRISGSIARLQNKGSNATSCDPASSRQSRRRRRAKTDGSARGVGGGFAGCWHTKRGEPRFFAMVKARPPKRGRLLLLSRSHGADRRAGPHFNRVRALFSQVYLYYPLRATERERLDTLQHRDGRLFAVSTECRRFAVNTPRSV